jgi:hypothetical protein
LGLLKIVRVASSNTGHSPSATQYLLGHRLVDLAEGSTLAPTALLFKSNMAVENFSKT